MQTPQEYLDKTASAVRRLFDGIDEYTEVLRRSIRGVTFVTGLPYGPEQDAAFAAWQEAKRDRLEAARRAERDYVAETFACDTLCGAVLQVAGKALETYGQNTSFPSGLPDAVKPAHAQYCVGRVVRTLPLGLIVYAARNQHTHFNDGLLREPSRSVFARLATGHGYGSGEVIADPAFDLSNPQLVSYAGNVTALIGWRSYGAYLADMEAMLGVPPKGGAQAS
jgi:hypothetical protein